MPTRTTLVAVAMLTGLLVSASANADDDAKKDKKSK
jgi:hypothetical protein